MSTSLFGHSGKRLDKEDSDYENISKSLLYCVCACACVVWGELHRDYLEKHTL